MSGITLADDKEDIIDYIFAKTVLLNANEEYVKGVTNYSEYIKCTIIDSSFSVIDTLCGVALYLLYFDTTNLESGKELQRNKDSLSLMCRLNREVKNYDSHEVLNAPREIIAADSLLRKFLSSKQIWMEDYTPYYIPYHPLFVDFTITPLEELSNKSCRKSK